jgi:hypothetical protein
MGQPLRWINVQAHPTWAPRASEARYQSCKLFLTNALRRIVIA